MNLHRFMRGGFSLGEAQLIGLVKKQSAYGVASAALRSAAGQVNASGDASGKGAGRIAATAANNFNGDVSQIMSALQTAQQAGSNQKANHAVSCGYLIGQTYSACKQRMVDMDGRDIGDIGRQALAHAQALSQIGGTSMPLGTINMNFQARINELDTIIGGNMPTQATKMQHLMSSFAGTLR